MDHTSFQTIIESLETSQAPLDKSFEETVSGKFFRRTPSRLPEDREFEELGCELSPLVLPARHLPTREMVAAIEASFGERATPLVSTWVKAWKRLVGNVDAFAAKVGYPAQSSTITDWLDEYMLKDLAAGRGSANTAAILLRRRAGSSAKQVRSNEQHALEDALKTTSLLEAGVPFALFVRFNHKSRYLITIDAQGVVKRRRPSHKLTEKLDQSFSAPNAYWLSSACLDSTQRAIVETENLAHLIATVSDMAGQGHSLAFLKSTELKGGTWVVDLTSAQTAEGASLALHAAMGLDFIKLAAISEADPCIARMLLQEFSSFTKEHRFFCVGGRIVCSTASHRAYSALDRNSKRRLDSHVAELYEPAARPGRYDRGESRLVEDRVLVAAMARKVRALLKELQEDVIGRAYLGPAFVVDMGWNGVDIDIIEINTFRNAGLYGADYARVALALSRNQDWLKVRTNLWRILIAGGCKPETIDNVLQRALGETQTKDSASHNWEPVDLADAGGRRVYSMKIPNEVF